MKANRLPPDDNVPPGRWVDGELPANVQLGAGTVIGGELAFKRFYSKLERALTIGEFCTMDGVHFDVGGNGQLEIGNHCYFTNAVLLCELAIEIGNFVMIGWNTTIADTDFHPIAPRDRIADAIACSPLGKGLKRPEIIQKRIVIDDDVWIGPNATILKGVHIGAGAFIEAGALIVTDVPPRSHVLGNPAKIIGTI